MVKMRPVFGRSVTASDVERLTSREGERAFVRLCATLVASAIGESTGDFVVPYWTERLAVPDRGVDAEYTAPDHILEAGGLLGPGRNVYQVKWRTVGTRPARSVIQELRRAVTGALKDLLSKDGSLPHRYVLMVNVDLSRSDRGSLSQALRMNCPQFEGRPVIIWAAAEIAAALNSHPHVRRAFFSEGRFCTLETAREELRARYETIGWSDFVGYDEPVRAIQKFVARSNDRLLVVTGLAYSGKTRTVIEALKNEGARVVWASNPDQVAEDDFRSFDNPSSKAVVVIDNCDAEHFEIFERWARSRTHVKTILISRWCPSVPDVPVVRLEGLSHENREALFGQLSPKAPHMMRDWVSRIAGNTPGLILYAQAALREMPERGLLTSERQKPRQLIGALLQRALLANLPTEERDALQVLAILPQVGIEGDAADELGAVLAVLSRHQLRVCQAIPKLQERHLLIRRGRFVEVVPELLANDLAAEVFKASADLITTLWLRLNSSAQDRLLRRLIGLSDDPAIAPLLDDILSESGWFHTLEDLRAQARRFRTLAEARPRAALQTLQRLLGHLDVSTLRDSVEGELRREIVWSLEALALRADTFPGAANLLLRLAEAENENISNNATGVFHGLFHWHYLEVAAPHSERLDFLFKAARDSSPTRRKLVAGAAGEAVLGRKFYPLHQRESLSPPEGPARLGTWEDVWTFHDSILRILRALTEDSDGDVAATAYYEITGSIRQMLRLSVLEDGLHRLADACFDTLRELAQNDLDLRQRSKLRGILDLIQYDLRHRVDEAAGSGRQHEGAVLAQEKLEEVRKLLRDESFAAQVKRWVGPRAWGDEHADMEAQPGGEPEPSAQQISELAAKGCAHAELLTPALMDWLMSDEAEHSPAFFMALGEHDTSRAWQDPIVERLGTAGGARTLGWYVAGVAKREGTAAEDILDHLSLDKPDHVEGMLAAAFLLPATERSVQRLLSLVDRRLASATEVLGGIRYGGWVRPVDPDLFATLVERLDDGGVEAATGLVELVASWLYFSREMSEELQERTWSLLERSTQSDKGLFPHSWDRVATWLAARKPQRFSDLLERLATTRDGLNSARTLAVLMDGAQVWNKLKELDRQGVLSSLLHLRMRGDGGPFWVYWCLQTFVDSDTDADILVRFAIENGERGALAVADVLDADRDGFWSVAEKLIIAFPDSGRLVSRLDSRAGTTGGWGSFVPKWRSRLDKAARLLNHPHPRVSQWARQVVDWLEDYIRSEEKEDQEHFIWDYRISRRELEGLLRKRDSPDRLWAIRRILKRAPTKDVLDLLTLDDIQEGLSKTDLPEPDRRKWEAYLAHWGGRA